MTPLISIMSDTLRFTGVTIYNPHHVVIPHGVTAIIGPNGSGKSQLAQIIARGANYMTNKIVYANQVKPTINIVAFTDIYSLTGFKVEYYQQRYESTMNDDIPEVGEMFSDLISSEIWQQLSPSLHLDALLHKKTNYLSSGELRKLLIVNALEEKPEVLVLDNPYIGLDVDSRRVVDDAIERISAAGVSVLLLITDPDDIPRYVDAVLPLSNMEIGQIIYNDGVHPIDTTLIEANDNTSSDNVKIKTVTELLGDNTYQIDDAASPVIEMKNVTVRYGQRMIINGVDWVVRQGESWALTGANGSGKSTLLSLVNADNPQAYSNDVSLFGRKRGTGESIWDIKANIGFMSSELHLFYRAGTETVNGVLYAGLTTAIGQFHPVTQQQKELVARWLDYFDISQLADRRFTTLSFGQQRLVLLIRAMIRRPRLLILDEPMHGLDRNTKQRVLSLIDTLSNDGSTLIYVTHCLSDMPACISHTKRLTKPS